MCSWSTENLGDVMLVGEASAKMEENFLSIRGKETRPENAAIFVRLESDGVSSLRGQGVSDSRILYPG